jgi:hypothetical protein
MLQISGAAAFASMTQGSGRQRSECSHQIAMASLAFSRGAQKAGHQAIDGFGVCFWPPLDDEVLLEVLEIFGHGAFPGIQRLHSNNVQPRILAISDSYQAMPSRPDFAGQNSGAGFEIGPIKPERGPPSASKLGTHMAFGTQGTHFPIEHTQQHATKPIWENASRASLRH